MCLPFPSLPCFKQGGGDVTTVWSAWTVVYNRDALPFRRVDTASSITNKSMAYILRSKLSDRPPLQLHSPPTSPENDLEMPRFVQDFLQAIIVEYCFVAHGWSSVHHVAPPK